MFDKFIGDEIAALGRTVKRIADALEAIQHQNLAATTQVISVTLGKTDASGRIHYREIRLNTPEVMGKTYGQNPHVVTLTGLGDGGDLPDGDYLVRVRPDMKDLDTWDWHDWRRL